MPRLILPTRFRASCGKDRFHHVCCAFRRVVRPSAARGGLLLIVLAAVLWGTVGVTTRAIFTLAETTALSVAFLRLALALPVLGSPRPPSSGGGFLRQPRAISC